MERKDEDGDDVVILSKKTISPILNVSCASHSFAKIVGL